MQDDVRISVIIPVHNGEAFLAEAIESVLMQSRPAAEILVINDGSTDGTADILKAYKGRVEARTFPHEGADAARNQGILLASGEYIAFCDADDLMHPDRLAVQSRALEGSPELDFVFGHLVEFQGSAAAVSRDGLNAKPGHCAGTLMARRAAMMRAGLFETGWKLASFMEWSFRIQDQGFHFRMLEKVVLYRRLHENNLSRREASVIAAEYARVIQRRLKRRGEENKEKPES